VTYQVIPEWLQPIKSEWMTVSKLAKRIGFRRPDGYVLNASTVIQRIGPRCHIYRRHAEGENYCRLYLVKELVARAAAHKLAPVDVSEESRRARHDSVAKKVLMREAALRMANGQFDAMQASHARSMETLRAAHQREIERWEHSLKDVSAILLQCEDIQPLPGVYLFVSAGEIVYVGQSKNVAKRVDGRANLVQVARMIRIDDAKRRDDTERYLIEMLRPKGNKQWNSSARAAS